MRACIGLLAFCSCTTPEGPDHTERLNALGLQVSALQSMQYEMGDKIEALEDLCAFNRMDLERLQTALTPKKPRRKKR